MAISMVHYLLVRDLVSQGGVPQGGALLEVGEANWYGDVPSQLLADDIQRFVPEPARRETLLARLNEIETMRPEPRSFSLAKLFYAIFYAPTEHQAIDFHGTEISQKLDLNEPIQLSRRFDIVVNHGTAEHVFNIGQVYRTIHDYTAPGGIMMHEGPFFGWIDHGFYTMQPTLFFDLAEFNQYRMYGMFITEIRSQLMLPVRSREELYELIQSKRIPENSQLFVVMRKPEQLAPFRVPMQGFYRGSLSDQGVRAWHELR